MTDAPDLAALAQETHDIAHLAQETHDIAQEIDALNKRALEALKPQNEVPHLDLQAIRDELSEAHRECFKELHRLEGELRGVDKFLAFLNPQTPHQPATTAEGDK